MDRLYWHQLHLIVDDKHDELVDEFLWALGAVSISNQSADESEIFERFHEKDERWRWVKKSALFEKHADKDEIVNETQRQLDGVVDAIEYELVLDQDWQRCSLSHFHPISINENLWICPSWLDVPNENATVIKIDPGMAFGTGSHETTKSCLKIMSKIVTPNMNVLDYGCGSGVLGIVALKLGAKHLFGVDVDPKALLVTRENLHKNHVEEGYDLFLPHEYQENVRSRPHQFDLVVANILADALMALSRTLLSQIAQGGYLILSGILDRQAQETINVYNEAAAESGIILAEWTLFTDKGWATLLVRKK